MADPLSGLRSLAAAVKLMARREDVPRYRWATVTSAGSPPEVVLEDDLTGAPRKVTASAIGPVQVGWRVRVERVRRNLTIVAAPAQVASLRDEVEAGPWVACALGAGFTGAAWVRKLGPGRAEITVGVTGAYPEGNTAGVVTIPAAYLPALPSGTYAPRLAAYFGGGYVGLASIEPTGLAVTQRTGAARTIAQVRGIYGL